MKKRYIAGAIGGAIAGLVAWKMASRESEISWDEVMESVPHSDHSQFIEVDGLRVHYQEFGVLNHPTLLLVHGYTASTYVWHSVAPLLAERGFHVIALDLIGFGYSSKPAWFDYSIASQARVVVRFMNRLGIGRAVIVGSSYGGAVSATIALDYPERVEKLVLVDAVSNDDVKSLPVFRLVTAKGIGEIITPFLSDSKMFAKYRMRNTMSPENHHLIDDERVVTAMRPLRARDGNRSVLSTARNWDAIRVQEDAQYINHPTLLIWGEKDTVIPIENGYRLHESILNSRFVIFRECGHVPQEEKPELFCEVLADFCHDSKGRLHLTENEKMRMG